jgi:hypothetical protein
VVGGRRAGCSKSLGELTSARRSSEHADRPAGCCDDVHMQGDALHRGRRTGDALVLGLLVGERCGGGEAHGGNKGRSRRTPQRQDSRPAGRRWSSWWGCAVQWLHLDLVKLGRRPCCYYKYKSYQQWPIDTSHHGRRRCS